MTGAAPTTTTTTMTIDGKSVDVSGLDATQRASLELYVQQSQRVPTERTCRKCHATYTATFGSLCTPCTEAALERDFERDYERHLDGKEARD